MSCYTFIDLCTCTHMYTRIHIYLIFLMYLHENSLYIYIYTKWGAGNRGFQDTPFYTTLIPKQGPKQGFTKAYLDLILDWGVLEGVP